MPSPSKTIRYFFEWSLFAFAYWFIPKLPRWVLRGVAHSLGGLAFLIHFDGRRTAIANLKVAFPGRYTTDEIEDLALKCYRSWARTYMDQLWTRRLTPENYRDYIDYQPNGIDLDALGKEGAIWMTPHYGNFEWIAAALSFRGIHYTAIAQPLKNPWLTPLLLKNREHLGHQIISQDKAMLKLLRVLTKGGHAAFLPDLTVKPDQTATIIEFFGLPVSVTALGPFLARRTGRPIVAGINIPLEDGSYLGTGTEPIYVTGDDSIQDIAQKCWSSIEPVIQQKPEHWLWMYKHFRYRAPDSNREYPPYASQNPHFDALIASVQSDI